MPQPTASDVHVNRPLTEISIAYANDVADFVADKVFPNIPVNNQSDRYFEYTRDNWFRSECRDRAPSTESAGSGFEVDNTPSYSCKPKGVHKDIDDQIRANHDSPMEPDRDATEFVTHQMLIKRELDWALAYFNTSIWTGSKSGTDVTPSTKWDAGGSVPIADLRQEITAIKQKIGRRPNTLVLAEEVWDALADNADFTARITGGASVKDPAIVMPNLLAQILRIERVLIAGAVYNTAAENDTIALSAVASRTGALLVYAAPRPSILQPSGGYTFSWRNYLGAAGPQGQVIKRFRMEHLESDRVEGKMAYDHKLVSGIAGAFFTACIT